MRWVRVVFGGCALAAVITTALYSGLRLGELLGLRWRDIDLDAGRLSIQQTLPRMRNGGMIFRQPKTHRSRRAVSVPVALVDGLRAHKAAQARSRLLAGPAWQDGDLAFTDGLGAPVSYTRLSRAFQEMLSSANLPRIHLHDLRHTMATLMLAAGEHPKVVSERLGHATVAITLDTYSHVLPGLQAAAAERLADTLRNVGAGSADNAP
jgi:integrase